MKGFYRLCVAVVPVMLLTACASTQEAVEPAAEPASTPTQERTFDSMGSGAEAMPAPEQSGFQGSPLDDPSSLLSKRVIYFDFDRAEVQQDQRDIVQAHAEYLAANRNLRVVLEGHTDERGSREYNMGLGERRANAVRSFLTLNGVSTSQIEVVSYGEERPVAMGQDEGSWRLNRRVEILYR
ncbi:MAG: peptidoglycan-associated lipoprotein Pal [Gammaproteobacteria bacterium]|jgi:peptidoglycan-associated lipoprotein|nr:peptidoglycan-associated lipoprotein Pal [Gammaproteobacteria bacterium]